MNKRERTKLVHEGNYIAEVDVELLEEPEGWSPYLSLEDAYRLDKCIVQYEKTCLENADLLLEEIDNLLGVLRLGAGPVGEDFDRPCRVCGFGKYRLFTDKNFTATGNFGLNPRGAAFKIFTCNNCGHAQLFFCLGGSNPPAWEKRSD